MKFINFLSFCLFAISKLPLETIAIMFDEVSSLHIWITISSLTNRDPNNHRAIIFRQIELNWINAPLEDDSDYIALYLDSEPDINILPVSVHRLNGLMNGQIITDYYLPQIDFYNETINGKIMFTKNNKLINNNNNDSLKTIYKLDGLNYEQQQPHKSQQNQNFFSNDYDNQAITFMNKNDLLIDECLGYCIAYISKNKILAKNCLRTNPNWMSEIYKFINSRSLPTLMIPGTHNSGTYTKKLDKNVLDLFNKYELNQDESIFNQLVYGIRHLDLRVGYKQVKLRNERFWIYHDIFRTEITVKEVLEQVEKFLELTKNELIIIDFHRFTVGFQNENLVTQREHHAKLIELILKHLEKYIIPSYLGLHAPISEYISLGKRIIIGYANKANILDSLILTNQINNNLLSNNNNNNNLQQIKDIDAINQEDDNLNQVSQQQKNKTNPIQLDNNNSIVNQNSLFKKMKLLTNSFMSFSNNNRQRNSNNQKMLIQNYNDIDGKKDDIDYDDLTSSSSKSSSSTAMLLKAQLFFSSVRHLWPNKDSIDGFAQYMNETTCRKYFGELSSSMIQLTPTVFGAISDKYDGNRNLAHIVNRLANDWIRNRWLHCINIVASDYFLGNDLIRLSIYSNKMRIFRNNSIDLNSYGKCKFRKIEHLLDKSKIPHQFAYQNNQQQLLPATNTRFASKQHFFERNNNIDLLSYDQQQQQQQSIRNSFNKQPKTNSFSQSTSDDPMIIKHKTSDGNEIYLKPLTPSFNGGRFVGADGVTSRQRKDSFVESVTDGFSNIYTSFKKLLNF